MDFNRILVPVVGTDADDEAIRLACRLAKKGKGKIWAVYVITVKRALPLNTEIEPETKHAEQVLDRAQRVAEEQDCKIETDLLQSRDAAPTIVDEAVERGADLIVMGVRYKMQYGQFSLGEVVPYVLKNAPCRVILYHQYIS